MRQILFISNNICFTVFLFMYDELTYNFLLLFFLDKIEEAQKELNGAEVSKKGKLTSTPV